MLEKKFVKKATFFVLLYIGYTLSPLSFGQQQDQWEDHEKRQEQLKELNRSISEVKNWIKSAQKKQSTLVNELRIAEKNISDNLRQIEVTERNIIAIEKDLTDLSQTESEQTRIMREQQQLIAQQVRATYAMGREQGIKLLLNADDPLTLQRVIKYYGYFNDARANQVAETRQAIISLEQTRQMILEKNQKLIDSRNRLSKNQQKLEKGRQLRASALAALNQNLTDKHTELTEMEHNQQQLEELVKEVERTIATIGLANDTTPFAQLRGKLDWPTDGTLQRKFGPVGQRSVGFPGVFFKTPLSQPVSAVHHGHVVFADWLRGFGLLLILDHGDDYMSLYGFNQALLKDTGDWVDSGEVIASSGNSGGQSQSGLYFEIRHKGKPSNPVRWLQKQQTKA